MTCRPTPTIVGEKSTPTGTKVASSSGPDGWNVTVVDPIGRLEPPDDPPPLLPVPGNDGRNGGDVVVGVTGWSGTVVAGTVVDGNGAVVGGAGAVVVGRIVVVGAAVVGGAVVGGVTSTTVRANTWVPAGNCRVADECGARRAVEHRHGPVGRQHRAGHRWSGRSRPVSGRRQRHVGHGRERGLPVERARRTSVECVVDDRGPVGRHDRSRRVRREHARRACATRSRDHDERGGRPVAPGASEVGAVGLIRDDAAVARDRRRRRRARTGLTGRRGRDELRWSPPWPGVPVVAAVHRNTLRGGRLVRAACRGPATNTTRVPSDDRSTVGPVTSRGAGAASGWSAAERSCSASA